MAKVSVQIVTWNSLRYIQDCLNSLSEQTFQDFNVLIIDNGSQDETVKFVRTNYPTATVLENFKNVGFSRGHNQGIKMSKAEYCLVLNPDVIVPKDFLSKLVSFADKHQAAGSFGGKILRLTTQAFDQSDQGLREAIKSDIIDSAGMEIRKSRNVVNIGEGQKDMGQFDRSREVFGISGACALYRRSALEEASVDNQYFDVDFFAYKEDIDLAWRLRLYGFSSWYVPEAICYHHRGLAAAAQIKIKTVRQHRRHVSRLLRAASLKNHHLMLVKNEQLKNIFLALPWLIGREIVMLGYALIFEPFQYRTIGSFFKQLPTALRRRKVIMSHARVSPDEIRRWFI